MLHELKKLGFSIVCTTTSRSQKSATLKFDSSWPVLPFLDSPSKFVYIDLKLSNETSDRGFVF